MGSAFVRYMALWEFTDIDGRAWRAWEVRPETLHGRARPGAPAGELLGTWVVFESADRREKRRLCPIPVGWEEATPEQLRRYVRAAEPVQRPGSGQEGQGAVVVRSEPLSHSATEPSREPSSEPATGDRERRQGSRTFRYPGGRYWTVYERPLDGDAGAGAQRVLLRFASGSRQLELIAPTSWMSWSDGELADVLYRAFPRGFTRWKPTALARRRGDPRAEPSRG